MPFYEKGPVRIHYEETGSGFPLFVIPGGGLNSALSFLAWGPQLCEKRPDITMDMVRAFLTNMYTNRADFVFTVTRDFVRTAQTPILIGPDDIPSHPYEVAMEVARLAPNAEVTIYPWKDTQVHIEEVANHTRRFLKAHEPVTDGPHM